LPDGPGRFPQGSTCPAVLRSHLKLGLHFHIRGCHPLWPDFPDRSINAFQCLFTPGYSIRILFRTPQPNVCGPATPDSPCESSGLGCSDFARHYSRNHGCFLFLWVLRWFTSPGSLRTPIYSECDNRYSIGWVPPFGHPRITDCLHLPEAFRSWPRPSSPTCAKASTRMLLVA
jgi:hypothetical protein